MEPNTYAASVRLQVLRRELDAANAEIRAIKARLHALEMRGNRRA